MEEQRKRWWALLALKAGAWFLYAFGGFILWLCLVYALGWSWFWSAVVTVIAVPILVKDDYENRNSRLAKIVYYPLKRYSSREN